MTPRCSIAMATYNKADALRRTLESIYRQTPGFPFEVIVVNDGSDDHTVDVCADFPVRYFFLDRPGYRNSAPARNLAYRSALGDIVIAQSDEVEHRTPDLIRSLADRMRPQVCVFATVNNVAADGTFLKRLVGSKPTRHRPYFYLGAVWRHDLYAVGGNDEDFTEYGGEDVWLGYCLAHRGIRFLYCDDLVGWHYDHEKPRIARAKHRSNELAEHKRLAAMRGEHPWTARAGAWT